MKRPNWFAALLVITLTVSMVGATQSVSVLAEPLPPAIEIDLFPNFDLGPIGIQLPDGMQEIVSFTGPATVEVYFEGTQDGDADDDDIDGLDEVETELVALSLSGFSPLLGPIQIGLNPNLATVGQIKENTNNTPGLLDVPPFAVTGTADMYFDIFFEVVMGGQTFHTIQPTRAWRTIDHKPPGPGQYQAREDIPLIDQSGFPTGYYLVFGNQPPPVAEVGGQVYPINTLAILAPWITLVAAIITGGMILRRRRARA